MSNRKNTGAHLRVGNFTVERRYGRMRFSDLDGLVTHSIDLTTARGTVMSELYDACREGNGNALRMMGDYLGVMELVLSVIPVSADMAFLRDLYALAERQLEATKGMYSHPDGDDAAILDEERQRYEDEQRVLADDAVHAEA